MYQDTCQMAEVYMINASIRNPPSLQNCSSEDPVQKNKGTIHFYFLCLSMFDLSLAPREMGANQIACKVQATRTWGCSIVDQNASVSHMMVDTGASNTLKKQKALGNSRISFRGTTELKNSNRVPWSVAPLSPPTHSSRSWPFINHLILKAFPGPIRNCANKNSFGFKGVMMAGTASATFTWPVAGRMAMVATMMDVVVAWSWLGKGEVWDNFLCLSIVQSSIDAAFFKYGPPKPHCNVPIGAHRNSRHTTEHQTLLL